MLTVILEANFIFKTASIGMDKHASTRFNTSQAFVSSGNLPSREKALKGSTTMAQIPCYLLSLLPPKLQRVL